MNYVQWYVTQTISNVHLNQQSDTHKKDTFRIEQNIAIHVLSMNVEDVYEEIDYWSNLNQWHTSRRI